VKIVAIGAGSASFGKAVLTDVLGASELSNLGTTLVLVDLNPDALERMYILAKLLKEHHGSKVSVEKTTDRCEALEGADYVITSVAMQRYPLWEQDFRVPLAYGFKHAEGENGGPGAVFHTMRSLNLMMPIAQDIERICPEALVLNFTNPESRVIMALSTLTKLRCVGLCHGVNTARNVICQILERREDELEIVTGGLNHFFWLLRLSDRKTGRDLYPLLKQRILSDPHCPGVPPLARRMLEFFGLFIFPSDKHIGEYLSWAYEETGLLWHYGQECRPVRMTPEPEAMDPLEAYINGARPIDAQFAAPSGEFAISIIMGIELDRERIIPAVNVPNSGGYVENLPLDAVVEVPALVDGQGLHPLSVGPLPEPLAALCRTQISIQKLLVQAYRERSRSLLLQALLIDPVVNSARNAELMLKEMLELQEEFLPEFS